MYIQQPDLSLDTKLGRVAILKTNTPIPPTYRYLFPDECYWIRDQLQSFVQQTLGTKNIALSSGALHNWGQIARIEEDYDNSQCEYFFAISPTDYSVNIQNFDQITQLIKQNQFIFLPIGLVLKVSLNKEIPDGFRKMTINEGQQFKEKLKKLMTTWSIVAFETGKFDGPGYGYKFHDNYGSECGEVFIVSVAPI